MKYKCDKCKNKLAVWNYMPGSGDYYNCDDCIPRGCSCNIIDGNDIKGEQYKDKKGRLLPCCEWDYNEFGFDELNEKDWEEIDNRTESRWW